MRIRSISSCDRFGNLCFCVALCHAATGLNQRKPSLHFISHPRKASGKIRKETRRYLENQKSRGLIRDYIPGEDFSIFSEATRSAFLVCDDLRRDSDLDASNNGITIVIL